MVWFRNGVLLQNSADYVMNGDDLMISNVQPRDLTSFQCLVNNEVGSSVDQLFLCGRSECVYTVAEKTDCVSLRMYTYRTYVQG